MNYRAPMILVCAILVSGACFAQGVIGDVLIGKLVKPTNGAWAWYDLTDSASDQAFVMRMAIVGEERVGLKQGYWLELEIVPMVGYRSVFKMLVTGPASDPKNLHKVLIREGRGDVVETPVPKGDAAGEAPPEPERTPAGEEDVAIRDGSTVKAERYQLVNGNEKLDVWLNDEVRPMGIVRMVSAAGELKLRNYGIGGQDARSVINDPLPAALGGKIEDMRVEAGMAPPESAPPPPEPAAPPENPNTPKPNREPAE